MKHLRTSIILITALSIGFISGRYFSLPFHDTKPGDSSNNQQVKENELILGEANRNKTEILEQEIIALRAELKTIKKELKNYQSLNNKHTQDTSKYQANTTLTKDILIESGVSEHLAQEIISKISHHEYRSLALQDKARREGYIGSARYTREKQQLSKDAPSIRNLLDKNIYDNFLYKTEQNNRVRISSVMSGSPAEQYGIQQGDIILNYANEKILSWQELRTLTAKGKYGEYVNLELLRNNRILSILVPRGPLGIKLGATRINPETEYPY